MCTHARNFAHMAAYLNGTSRLGKGKRKRSTSLAAVRVGALTPTNRESEVMVLRLATGKRQGTLPLVFPTYYSTASV
jgi:hypothetical protein